MATPRSLLKFACVAAFALAACDKSTFNGSSGKVPAKAPAPVTPVKPITNPPSADGHPAVPQTTSSGSATETFSITSNQGMIDMVWIIDNSGSMREEAAAVRQNFASFLTSVQSRSDMHVALISMKEGADPFGTSKGSTGVTLPDQFVAQGNVQVDAWVGSHDELLLLAAATCAAGESNLAGSIDALPGANKVCGQTINFETTESDRGVAAAGSLVSFFRPQAKKVFVVVSDDLAYGVDDTNFLNLVKPGLGGAAPALFGFVGLDANRPGCDISNVGQNYINVAKDTGGQMFDICETDWSANFKKLSDNVVNIASTSFTVKAPVVKAVTAAVVDGKPISASAVHVTGSIVSVDPTAIPAGAKSITISYTTGT